MNEIVTSNEYLAAFFKEFHRLRRRPMNGQARLAWYVDTTPQDVVRKTLDEMRQFKTLPEGEGAEKVAGSGTFSFFPQPLPDDPAYPAWLSRLADALEAEFHTRLAHRAGFSATLKSALNRGWPARNASAILQNHGG